MSEETLSALKIGGILTLITLVLGFLFYDPVRVERNRIEKELDEDGYSIVSKSYDYDYICNKKSNIIHSCNCEYAMEISEDNILYLAGDAQKAIDGLGYSPCDYCLVGLRDE